MFGVEEVMMTDAKKKRGTKGASQTIPRGEMQFKLVMKDEIMIAPQD